MSLPELQAAVSHLPTAELKVFTQWFEEYLADLWDEQIEADALAGRLDWLADEARADVKAGRSTDR
jgi:hypothetical protein